MIDSTEFRPVRWGLLGTGTICKTFAEALRAVPGATLQAVGSRTLESAQIFATRHGAKQACGSYEDLVNMSEVDAVYIGTPHPLHCSNALLALHAGKPVLCEKPFTLNAREAALVIDTARSRGLFLMEAMWTRFLPATVQVREWIREGRIGEPRMLRADFGFRTEWNPASRWLDLALGGGALLDVGVYPVSYASMLFGPTTQSVHSTVNLGATGVDEQAAMLLQYGSGAMAVLGCAVRTRLTQQADILGTEGKIVVPNFFRATEAVHQLTSGDPVTKLLPHEVNGFEYQIREVARCLALGKKESEVMPLDETLEIMKLLDRIRADWKLKYPGE